MLGDGDCPHHGPGCEADPREGQDFDWTEPASVITVDEMRAWYDRMHIAMHADEPLYVTPEEYADIKRRFSGAPLPPPYYPTPVPASFLGTPVIIDAEKAAQQRGTTP